MQLFKKHGYNKQIDQNSLVGRGRLVAVSGLVRRAAQRTRIKLVEQKGDEKYFVLFGGLAERVSDKLQRHGTNDQARNESMRVNQVKLEQQIIAADRDRAQYDKHVEDILFKERERHMDAFEPGQLGQ